MTLCRIVLSKMLLAAQLLGFLLALLLLLLLALLVSLGRLLPRQRDTRPKPLANSEYLNLCRKDRRLNKAPEL